MALEIRYFGWTAFEFITEKGMRVLVDPMLAGSSQRGIPPSTEPLENFDGVQLILVTHTAADHLGQAFEIMRRSKANLVCDAATRFRATEEAGISEQRIYSMVSGIQYEFEGVAIKALAAQHHSLAKTKGGYITSQPLSYLISFSTGERIFFAGDTSIHSDLKLYGELYAPQVAMLGVGGVDRHGQSATELSPREAALAAKWLGIQLAIPMHYRLNEGDEFIEELPKQSPAVKGLVMKSGERYTYSLKA